MEKRQTGLVSVREMNSTDYVDACMRIEKNSRKLKNGCIEWLGRVESDGPIFQGQVVADVILDPSASLEEQRAQMHESTKNLIRMSKAGAAPVFQGSRIAARVMGGSLSAFLQQLN